MKEIITYILEHTILYVFSLLVLGFAAGVIFYQLIKKFLHSSFDIENETIDQKLKTPFYLIFSLVVAEIFFHLSKMEGEISFFISKTLFVGFVIVFAWLISRVINLVSIIVERQLKTDKVDNLQERKILTQFAYINKIIYFILILITVSVILLSFEQVRQVGLSLLASAGITSIIIGLAAQKTISNLIAGFQIAFTQPIRLDDVVIVEGEWGRVEEITLTYVVIRIWDWRRLIVPLTNFIEKPFQNWTRDKSELLGSVSLWVDYTIPVDEIRIEMQRLLNASPLWDKKIEVLQVIDSSEKAMHIRGLMTSKNSQDSWDLRCFVREGLIKYIQENHPESLPKLRIDTNQKTS